MLMRRMFLVVAFLGLSTAHFNSAMDSPTQKRTPHQKPTYAARLIFSDETERELTVSEYAEVCKFSKTIGNLAADFEGSTDTPVIHLNCNNNFFTALCALFKLNGFSSSIVTGNQWTFMDETLSSVTEHLACSLIAIAEYLDLERHLPFHAISKTCFSKVQNTAIGAAYLARWRRTEIPNGPLLTKSCYTTTPEPLPQKTSFSHFTSTHNGKTYTIDTSNGCIRGPLSGDMWPIIPNDVLVHDPIMFGALVYRFSNTGIYAHTPNGNTVATVLREQEAKDWNEIQTDTYYVQTWDALSKKFEVAPFSWKTKSSNTIFACFIDNETLHVGPIDFDDSSSNNTAVLTFNTAKTDATRAQYWQLKRNMPDDFTRVLLEETT